VDQTIEIVLELLKIVPPAEVPTNSPVATSVASVMITSNVKPLKVEPAVGEQSVHVRTKFP
jgi:hypothetical protein